MLKTARWRWACCSSSFITVVPALLTKAASCCPCMLLTCAPALPAAPVSAARDPLQDRGATSAAPTFSQPSAGMTGRPEDA